MNENEKNELYASEETAEAEIVAEAAVEVCAEQAGSIPEAEPTPEERLAAIQAKNKRMKKRILVVTGCVLAGLALLLGGLLLAEHLIAKKTSKTPEFDYYFYDPYVGDIMQNPQYLALNRDLFYCADPLGYGEREIVTESNLQSFDNRVAFLYFYVQTVISGDETMYNALFNDNYFKNHKPQAAFNQQMVYDIDIRYQGGEDQTNGDRLEVYVLSYKIYENDGSFHRDIGSDMSRDRVITLRVPKDGGITIENITTYYPSDAGK